MAFSHASSRFRPSPEVMDGQAPVTAFDGRLAWRRSRWLQAMLCLLAVAAVAAMWLSDLPRPVCIVVDALVLGYMAWLLHRESRRPACVFARVSDAAEWRIESEGRVETLRHVDASFRGRLVVLTLEEATGKARRYVWWPDTLDAAGRRMLRLAVGVMRGNEAKRADA